jgi:3-oxoadipate CoA-transferase alpha subunit
MAAAATTTIVQVDRLVPLGSIDPETVVTPGIYVDRVVELGERPWLRHGEFVGGVTVEGAPLDAAAAASGSAAPTSAAPASATPGGN